MIIRTKKQKKPLASTVVYDNQLLSVKGVAQREPWKDRDGSRNSGVFHFCNKITITIKNEGSSAIDTENDNKPLAINLDVKGKLDRITSINVNPASNPGLSLSVKDGLLIIQHFHINPEAFLEIAFLGYFKVNLEELY